MRKLFSFLGCFLVLSLSLQATQESENSTCPIPSQLSIAAQTATPIAPKRTWALGDQRLTTATYVKVNVGKANLVTWIAVTSDDGTLKIIDELGDPAFSLKGLHARGGATWSPKIAAVDPKSRYLITLGGTSEPVVRILNETGVFNPKPMKGHKYGGSPPKFAVHAAKILGDHVLTVMTSGEIGVWKWTGKDLILSHFTHAQARSIEGGSRLQLLNDVVVAAAVAPDASALILGTRDGRLMRYTAPELLKSQMKIAPSHEWKEDSLKRLHAKEFFGAEFSPDGKTLVTSVRLAGPSPMQSAILVLNPQTLETTAVMRGHEDTAAPMFLKFADPNYLVSVSTGRESTMRMWDVRDGRALNLIWVEKDPSTNSINSRGFADAFLSAAISPEGKTIVTGTDGGNITAWEIPSGKRIGTTRIQCDIRAIVFSPDGRQFVAVAERGKAYQFDLASFRKPE